MVWYPMNSPPQHSRTLAQERPQPTRLLLSHQISTISRAIGRYSFSVFHRGFD